jgi:hypothetical protein
MRSHLEKQDISARFACLFIILHEFISFLLHVNHTNIFFSQYNSNFIAKQRGELFLDTAEKKCRSVKNFKCKCIFLRDHVKIEEEFVSKGLSKVVMNFDMFFASGSPARFIVSCL